MPHSIDYFNLIAWFSKKKTKIGYAHHTERGTIRIKADDHLDANKLGKAIMQGLEIEKR